MKIYYSLIAWLVFLAILFSNAGNLKAADVPTISLDPQSGNLSIGQPIEVKLNLDTAGKTADGVDIAHLNYPADVLAVDKVTSGSIFQVTLVGKDNGKLSLVGTVQPGSSGYNGAGTVATITFKALRQSNEAKLFFDFTQGSTTDCNIAEHGTARDILAAVSEAKFIVGSTSATPCSDCAGSNMTNPSSVSPSGDGNNISNQPGTSVNQSGGSSSGQVAITPKPSKSTSVQGSFFEAKNIYVIVVIALLVIVTISLVWRIIKSRKKGAVSSPKSRNDLDFPES